MDKSEIHIRYNVFMNISKVSQLMLEIKFKFHKYMYSCIMNNIFITFRKAVTIPLSSALSVISSELIFHLINFCCLMSFCHSSK